MKYRAEIDGLRALAVIPVVLFHAGFESFQGGFVGVDVFFVISGYLITTILMEEIGGSRFTLIGFYERRARRILPALFFVMLACIPLAWMMMLPAEMLDFSQALLATTLFTSNVLFWRQGGYFGAIAEENPLLHTWSLAVEEQYYLIFPLFLLAVWRLGARKMTLVLALIGGASLVLSEFGWRYSPSANFFLAPTRAWELLAGSLAAFVVRERGVRSNHLVSLAGLAAIIYSIMAFSEDVPFPSTYALIPVIGVVALILFGGDRTLVAKWLKSAPLVGVGLASYSIYLWHQPILAFYRMHAGEPGRWVAAALCGASLVAGGVSWRYVEKPFRDRSAMGRRAVFVFSGIGMFVFLVIGIVGVDSKGFFKQRFKPEDRAFLEVLLEDNPEYVRRRFNSLQGAEWGGERTRVLLIGDSYGQDLVNAVAEGGLLARYDVSTKLADARCGVLFVEADRLTKNHGQVDAARCRVANLLGDSSLRERMIRADEVWLVSSWKDWQVELLSESLDHVRRVTGAKVRVFGRKDFPGFEPRKFLGLSQQDRANLTVGVPEDRLWVHRRVMEIAGAAHVDVQSMLCSGQVATCSPFDGMGRLKTFDGAHLTPHGAKLLGGELSGVL